MIDANVFMSSLTAFTGGCMEARLWLVLGSVLYYSSCDRAVITCINLYFYSSPAYTEAKLLFDR